MAKLILWIQTILVPWLGAPGVFVVAALDASFLSIPEVGDVLVVTSGLRDARTGWLCALMATLGSLAGSAALFFVGRRGGEGFLERRFGAARLKHAREAFARWDVLALAVPAIMPPPVPLKPFVVAAGVFRVPFRRFAASLLLGRGARYAFWVSLAILFGQRAQEVLKAVDRFSGERPLVAAMVLALLILVGLWLRRRRLAVAPRPADDAVV